MGLSIAKSFNLFCPSMDIHQASSALRKDIILILPVQENANQDTPPCHLKLHNPIPCNPKWMHLATGLLSQPRTVFAKITTVFVENLERGPDVQVPFFRSTVKTAY